MSMSQLVSAMEEQMISKAIADNVQWEQLPKRVKLFLGSSEEYVRRIKEHCMRQRLRWSESPARSLCREADYYEELIKFIRKAQTPFPYQLSDYVCRIMRVTPFKYYFDLIMEVMKQELSYDTIPNFTAADALRVTGIGRNEFINIMNSSRAKLMWKLNRSILKDALPTVPCEFALQPWWLVNVVNITADEYKKLSEEELSLVQRCAETQGGCLLAELDTHLLWQLYKKGLIYLDVPISGKDRFRVSSLEGFVSNRNLQTEDSDDQLLYALLVTSSEQATVEEMAVTLQADIKQLCAAISLACRLGWAEKAFEVERELNKISSSSQLSDADDASNNASQDSLLFDSQLKAFQKPSDAASGAAVGAGGLERLRIALMVDANLTSFLMMGSFSYELKQQAVTLFEAGKLGERSVTELCEELRSVETTVLEGELKKFTEHASSLRHALMCLRLPERPSALPAVRSSTAENLNEEEEVGPTTRSSSSANSVSSEKDREDQLPPSSQATSSTAADVSAAVLATASAGSLNRVDMLRCESLAELSPETLQRLLQRDYEVVVSIVPLPKPLSIVSPEGTGPVHFGAPAPAFTSPWTKLLLYASACSGPVTLALVRGQRLRSLPPPLLGCKRAMIWTWSGANVGGVGGKMGGSLVEGTTLLHALNNILRHTAVLVQPIAEDGVWLDMEGSPETVDVPLPLPISWKELGLKGIVEGKAREPTEEALEIERPVVPKGRLKIRIGSDSMSQEVLKTGVETRGRSQLEQVPSATLSSLSTSRGSGSRGNSSNRGSSTTSSNAADSLSSQDLADVPEAVRRWVRHETVRRALKELRLYTVGYFRLMRLKKAISSEGERGGTAVDNRVAGDEDGEEWVPHSIEFGIPLFNADLCQKVCESIRTQHMLSPRQLSVQKEAMRLLLYQLRLFISDYRANGPIAKGMLSGNIEQLRSTAIKWSKMDRPKFEVLSPVTRVVSSRNGQTSIAWQQRCDLNATALSRRGGREGVGHSYVGDTRSPRWQLSESFTPRLVPPLLSHAQSEDDVDQSQEEESSLTEEVLPGVNLLFDGQFLRPLDLSSFLQGTAPPTFIANAAAAAQLLVK